MSLQGLLDVADLELGAVANIYLDQDLLLLTRASGSRACETSSCLRDKRVVSHMLNRYAKWLQLRTMYPDAALGMPSTGERFVRQHADGMYSAYR